MVRKLILAGLFAAAGLVVVLSSSGPAVSADDKDDKTPEISEIMLKGHKGTDAFLAKIKGEAKGEMWEDAVAHAKALAVFGEALGKNKPPKGDEKSWKTLTDKYKANTKAVLKGAEDKNAKAVNAALGAIGKMCADCHKAHKQ